MQRLLWAVYERSNAAFVVLALRPLADGTYEPDHPPADISPLPTSVHAYRHTAEAVGGKKGHDCAGSA
jgi:hypothetical protein